MDITKYILVLVVLFVDSDAGGHEESHHDHVKLHVPEFIQHDHHTKVITIHHHHHKPKKEHHHHHHHHHQKPHIPYAPPKYHYNHKHSKSSSHSVSKGHTSVGPKSHGKHHGHHGKHGSAGHGHHSPSPSFESNYGAFLPSVPKIPSPQIHGVVHTVQQVKVFDSLPGGIKTGDSGYQVTEQEEEGEDDVFTSVNSLSQSYPGAYGYEGNAAEQNHYSDAAHFSTNQSPNTDPFAAAQPQPTYSNIEDFATQNQATQSSSNMQPSYSEITDYNTPENSLIGLGNGGSDHSLLSYADAAQDVTPVSFSREAGTQHAINSGGVETIAY
ncbi:polycomb group protein Pc-like [Bicyclus anynana]|uniref:Polycomb group protein Pc-like n=1 Tax=Bicyclus anynana TaxID=110368 RepID=A0A6J1N121_BICAN|nr:polycomb group protein Pc-like [Bicyclus anynana]